MKLTIFGATGRIGRHLLEQAVAAGHDVTAVVRDRARLPARVSRQPPVVVADMAAADPAELEPAVNGADAVLSALGPRTPSDPPVTYPGTKAIAEAMRIAGVRRIVVVSAAPVGTVPSPGRPAPPRHDPGDGFVTRHVLTRVAHALFGKNYADLAQMEELLRDSELDWTVVRPPRLTDGPGTGDYRTALGQNVRGGWRVPRGDVAHLMLRVLDQPETIRQTVGVAI